MPAPVQGAGLALLVVAAGLLHVDRLAFIYFQFCLGWETWGTRRMATFLYAGVRDRGSTAVG